MFRFGRRAKQNTFEDVVVDVSEKNGVRSLHLGSEAIQSSMRVKDPYELVLGYSRCMFAFLLFRDEPANIVMIGLGGGSITKFVHRYLSRSSITTVELLPQVVQVARSMFFLPEDDARNRVIIGDGVEYIEKLKAPVDAIFLDAFGPTGIAEALSSEPFFCRCREQLTEDGVLVVNLWGSDPLFSTYVARLSTVFDGMILCLPARQRGNVTALCFNRHSGNPTWASLSLIAQTLEEKYSLEFKEFVIDLMRMNEYDDQQLLI